MDSKFITQIANELGIREFQVLNTINLLKDGATVPFIARYRKEMTGSLDEVVIASIRDRYEQILELEKRREAIINSIKEQEKLTPELEKQILEAGTMSELEDIYLPYRPKRRTRATIAREKGLEPLANIIFAQSNIDIGVKATAFLDPEQDVKTVEDALSGARDIIAEWVNEDKGSRERVRNLFSRKASITSRAIRGKELEGIKYESYFDWNESLLKAPSHRLLAMFRGENEGFLKVSIEPGEEEALELLNRKFIRARNAAAGQVELAVKDSYK